MSIDRKKTNNAQKIAFGMVRLFLPKDTSKYTNQRLWFTFTFRFERTGLSWSCRSSSSMAASKKARNEFYVLRIKFPVDIGVTDWARIEVRAIARRTVHGRSVRHTYLAHCPTGLCRGTQFNHRFGRRVELWTAKELINDQHLERSYALETFHERIANLRKVTLPSPSLVNWND